MAEVNEKLMKNLEQTNNSESGNQAYNETEFDAVSAINDMKQNMVSRSEYDKVLAEKNKYLKALINGTQEPTAAPKEPISLDELRGKVFGSEENGWNTQCKSELEFVQNLIELRNETIEQEGWDPMAGPNPNDPNALYMPTNDDYEGAQEFVDYTQAAIDAADGSSKKFALTFGGGLLDAGPTVNPKIKRSNN